MTVRCTQLLLYFFLGSLIFCCFSFLQTLFLHLPSTPAHFLMPLGLGGVAGLLIGDRTLRIRELDAALQRADKQLHTQAKENEERSQQLFAVHQAAQLLFDPETGVIVTCNKAAQHFYGYSAEEFVGKTYMDLHSAAPAAVQKDMHQALSLEQCSFRYNHRGKFGEIGLVDVITIPVPYHDRILLHAVILNSSGPNTAEAHLRRKTLEQRLLLDSIPVAIWYLRDVETYGMVNKAYAEYFNLDTKEIAHKRLDTILGKETLALALASNRQVFTGKKALHYEQWITLGNKPCYMAITKTPRLDKKGNVEFVVCTATDITRMQQTRDLLRVERDLHVAVSTTTSFVETLRICLEKAIEVSQTDCGGLYLVDPEEGSLTLTAHYGLSKRFVQTASQYSGDSEHAQLVQRNQPVYACYADLLQRGKNETLEQEGLLAMGIIPISFQGRTVACLNVASKRLEHIPRFNRLALERVAMHIGTFLTRKEQDRLILQHQQNLESLFHSIQDFVFILDMEGSIVSLNSAAAVRLGYQQKELIGKNFQVLHPKERRDEVRKIVSTMPGKEQAPFLAPLVSSNDTRIPVETRVTRGQWNGRQVSFCLSRDISSRLQIERQQRLLLKNEGLERVAGAMAHHFNNLMAIVAGNLQLAVDDIVPESRASSLLANALIGTRRASELGQALLIYTGQFAEIVTPINLSDFCHQQLDAARIAPPANITLTVDLASPGPVVAANHPHLVQILSSLITNAVESIGTTTGQIVLRVRSMDREAIGDANIFPAGWIPVDHRYGCLEIIDSGTGIDERQMTNIFDLFYSEKFVGRGLGLALALSIVKRLDGAITVASQPDRGSTFQVLLPEQQQPVQQA